MYNGYNSPPLTNNPFISDPTNAQSRFPDISGSNSPEPNASQFTSWMQPGGSQQQQQQQYQQQYQQQQQMPPQLSGVGYNPTGMTPQFQPSSGFGQQMVGQISGSSYNYLQGPSTPQTAYNPVQQQLQNPTYSAVAQLDPYSSLGQWNSNNPPSAPQQQSSSFVTSPTSPTSPITTSRSATGAIHPREYIKSHKAEIESWDPYAWKQFLNVYDELKEAWAVRKKEVDGRAQQLLMQMQYSGGYYPQMQQEADRLQGVCL